MQNIQEIILRKDSEWSIIDGEPCRVTDFRPMSTIENGRVRALDRTTPHAAIDLECKKIKALIVGFITHYIDFTNLWMAFKERGISKNEEVLIFWTTKHYNKKIYKILSKIMPKMWIMVCPKGAYDLTNNYDDENYRPELTGGARTRATMPIIDWKPEVME